MVVSWIRNNSSCTKNVVDENNELQIHKNSYYILTF